VRTGQPRLVWSPRCWEWIQAARCARPRRIAAQRAVEWQTRLLSPPTRPMEPNVGRPKGLGNISDIRCRICRHWFIIARAGLYSVFSARVHLNNVWASASAACHHPLVLLEPVSFVRDPHGAHRARVFGCRLHLC